MEDLDFSVKPTVSWRGYAKFKYLMDADFFARKLSKKLTGKFDLFKGEQKVFSYEGGDVSGPEWMNGQKAKDGNTTSDFRYHVVSKPDTGQARFTTVSAATRWVRSTSAMYAGYKFSLIDAETGTVISRWDGGEVVAQQSAVSN